MKKSLLTIAALGLALMSFSSCKKEAEQEIAPEMYEYTFLLKEGSKTLGATKSSLGEDETGLYLKWENNDQLTTITHSTVSGNSGYSYCQYSKVAVPTEETDPITFTIGSYRPLNKDDMVYCASPYISNPGSNPENVTMSVSNLQKQNGAVFNGKYLPMVSVPFPISSAIASSNGTSSEGEAVTFYSLGSVIEFDVFSPTGKYAGESIQKVTFTTSGTDYIAGNFSFDMTRVSSTNASALQIEGYTGQSVAVELDAALGISATNVDKDHAAKVYMVVAPGTHAGSLVVETDVAKYTYTIPSKEFQRAAVRRFGVNLEKEDARNESLTTGDYVILAHYNSSGYWAMSGVPNAANGTRLAQESFSLWNGSDSEVVLQDKNLVWTLSKSNGKYIITNKESGNQLNYNNSGSASTAATGKAFSITEGVEDNAGMYTVTNTSSNSTFTLRHNSNSKWFAFYNTVTSMTDYFYFVKAIIKTKLAAPQNILADAEDDDSVIVIWDEVEDAESYDVTLNGVTQNTTETSCTFDNIPAGFYTVSVIAKNSNTDAFVDSDAAVSNTVKVGAPDLAKPTIVTFKQTATGFSAEWVAGDTYTSSYEWLLYAGSVATAQLVGTGETGSTNISIAFESSDFPEASFIADETYYLIVTAKAAGFTSTASDPADFIAVSSIDDLPVLPYGTILMSADFSGMSSLNKGSNQYALGNYQSGWSGNVYSIGTSGSACKEYIRLGTNSSASIDSPTMGAVQSYEGTLNVSLSFDLMGWKNNEINSITVTVVGGGVFAASGLTTYTATPTKYGNGGTVVDFDGNTFSVKINNVDPSTYLQFSGKRTFIDNVSVEVVE